MRSATAAARGFALMLSVLSAFGGLLRLKGGRLMTFRLALVHGAVRRFASGRIVSGVLSRFGGASPG